MPHDPMYPGEVGRVLGVDTDTVLRWGVVGLVGLVESTVPTSPLVGGSPDEEGRYLAVEYDTVYALVHDGGPRKSAGARALVREAGMWWNAADKRPPVKRRNLTPDLEVLDAAELAEVALSEAVVHASRSARPVWPLLCTAHETAVAGGRPDLEPILAGLGKEHPAEPWGIRVSADWMRPGSWWERRTA
ncbi:hypothetical protein [Nocardiopsis sp. CC223A]|uniref:hypothetical protein n=1 Tax=Nocardiopsis sp. CC223A TaxID=3044051 RepID=UPI00278BD05E|nr:hypothetical protein [Nocardiopsis sp. CC223A]